MKKYTLTNETIEIDGHTLYRIQALIDIPQIGVKTGDLGGYIKSENNLSQNGSCWVSSYENAVISGHAKVLGDAVISENAVICGNAVILGHTKVFGNAIVSRNAKVFGNAQISGLSSIISGNANIGKNAYIQTMKNYICIGPIGTRDDYTTFYKDKDGNVWVACGCFNDMISNFREKVIQTHRGTHYETEYLSASIFAEGYLTLE